jgi:hypothetical protein
VSKRIKKVEHQRWQAQCVLYANAPYDLLTDASVKALETKITLSDKALELARHWLKEMMSETHSQNEQKLQETPES